MKPEGIVHSWSVKGLTAEKIETETCRLIEMTKERYMKIANLNKKQVNYESVIKALIETEMEFQTSQSSLDFFQHAAEDKSIRLASLEAEQSLTDFSIEISTNKDIFDKVEYYKEKYGFENLEPEVKRYAEKFLLYGRRNGLHLDKKKREEIKKLQKKISSLEIEFTSNLNEDVSYETFDRKELLGVPQDLLDSFEIDEETKKCKVTMKYPHFFPVMCKCRIPDTRRRMDVMFNSRCMDVNTKILEEIVKLRHEKAQLLGYKNHAAFIQEIRMAKNPETVEKFLSELAEKLQPIWKKEKEEMLKLKEKECQEQCIDFDHKFKHWDNHYYKTLIEENVYSVNKEKLREYFPLDKVTEGMFSIYQGLLGFTFTLVPNVEAWHHEVKLYKVEDTKSKELCGYFFLDIHPRDGKYGHAAIFKIQPPSINADGSRQVPVCAMMANFTKSTSEKPSLLTHDEVETYFHEFGHIMHSISDKGFTGQSVERDFVEAPSQMLENWCWNEEPLRLMSGHYKDGSPIPDELLHKLINSRKANAGGFNLGQIIYAVFDQKIHTRAESDVRAVFFETEKAIKDVESMEETSFPATFTHMMGYAAQYYGYLWSEVYSFDMFESRFAKEGILNPKVGADYRNLVLAPGGTKDAFDLLRDFLGRDPTPDAFLKAKGLSS